MPQLGVIGGTVLLGKEIFTRAREKIFFTPYGKAKIYLTDELAYLPRHGGPGDSYIFPHRINYAANLWAFKDAGIETVISLNSTGSLKLDIQPGILVIPDDFISLYNIPTVFLDVSRHITPILDGEVRAKLLKSAEMAGVSVFNGGIYWQSQGPRLETKAEISFISQYADLVGMTMGSEATIACELELPYGSICSVDNYAHGIVKSTLTDQAIREAAANQADVCLAIISAYLAL